MRGKILGFDEPAASCTTIAEVGVVAGAAAECGTAAPLINARQASRSSAHCIQGWECHPVGQSNPSDIPCQVFADCLCHGGSDQLAGQTTFDKEPISGKKLIINNNNENGNFKQRIMSKIHS